MSVLIKTLLAKQIWRVIKKCDSLVAQTLRLKYFRSGNVLNAKLGQRPSYLWRSLLTSLELIKDGLFWRIGNGTKA